MVPKIPSVKLNNGYEMPMIGLGTWKSAPGQVEQAVKDAIDAGYRHIDCAMAYQNEQEVGTAIQQKMADGTIRREDIFVVSKLWNTFHTPSTVEPTLRKTLKDLQLDYLDLYLVHWPMGYIENKGMFPKDENGKFIYNDVDYLDTWKAMENCVRLGLTRSIGISNFNSQQIQRILDNCSIKPVTNQVECHPYLNQKKLLKFCTDRGIVLTAYSPLGSPDRPWAKPTDPVLLQDPKLVELSTKYNKSVAQILLRFQTQRGIVVTPKSVTKSRIISNLDCFDFTLSESDMNSIESMDCNGRGCKLEWVQDHQYFPFHIEF